ncbi:MAG: S-layer homology domain-containing protein, partial [Clostridiales bacterium]|nr:S-layer homology domain-containing protein [Clostridiales bacterium]
MQKFKKAFTLFVTVVMMLGILCTGSFAADTAPAGAPSDAALQQAAVEGASITGGTVTPGGGGAPAGGPPAAVNTGASSTADLTDYAQVDSKEAVAVMVKLGLIKGKVQADNTVAYLPDSSLTRAEMAKLIAAASVLVSKEKITGTATFSDIEGNWAADYIKFGADKGIIAGIGGGKYNPTGTITGLETAKLLLAAMGVEGLSGSDWATKTEAAAKEKGLLVGTKSVNDKAIDRDDTAQLIYNALQASTGAASLPQAIVVKETAEKDSLVIGKNTLVTALEGKLVTLVVGGTETQIAAGTYNKATLVITDKLTKNPSSYTGRGIENYRMAISVDKTGIVKSQSVAQAVTGTYTASAATGLNVNSTSDNFTAVMVNGATYSIKDSKFVLDSKSDGSNVSDFSGMGSAITAYNDAVVTLDNVDITTVGVAKCAVFSDSGADVLLENSKFKVMGGTLYDGYVNTADQVKMVAPPWVLGIMGNARGTNLMGQCSTMTVVNTTCEANKWGVLSTDSGKNMVLTVVDSTLTLLDKNPKDPFSTNYGSGYGTYIIGGAQEYFYGATFNVGTYASILTGGDATYASSTFAAPVSVYPLIMTDTGKTEKNFMGMDEPVYSVAPSTTAVFSGITGKGKVTTINSDAFGFMAHNSGSLTITDGTVVNSDNASFLLKAGDVKVVVSDGAKLNTKDGILLQMIDNDDSLVGADMSQGAPNFYTEFNEKAGYPGLDYAVDTTAKAGGMGGGGANTNTFTATDVTLTGNIYNGTGHFGGQSGDALEVTLGKGASLTGAISTTSIIHVDENGKQNTHFTIDQYWYLGHVANKVYSNGTSKIAVTLKDGATWTATGEGIITSLSIAKGCTL